MFGETQPVLVFFSPGLFFRRRCFIFRHLLPSCYIQSTAHFSCCIIFCLWHSVPGTLYDTFQAGRRFLLLEDEADPRKARKYVVRYSYIVHRMIEEKVTNFASQSKAAGAYAY